MKLVVQQAPLGCAIACCASLVNVSYAEMKKSFCDAKSKEHTTGFYNRDIISTLQKRGVAMRVFSARRWGKKKVISGSIVFIARSKAYPFDHYLVKVKQGWMNPWINFPSIVPAQAGYHKKLPGRLQWLIIPERQVNVVH